MEKKIYDFLVIGAGVVGASIFNKLCLNGYSSIIVDKQDIVNNGYDLSINKYKKSVYKPVEYPSTAEILADLNELELEITAGLAELGDLL